MPNAAFYERLSGIDTLALCGPIVAGGREGIVSGQGQDFAIFHDIETGMTAEYSWLIIERIRARAK
jgi:hypothetical protein